MIRELDDMGTQMSEMCRAIANLRSLLPMIPELDETLVIAAGKRGSRRWGYADGGAV